MDIETYQDEENTQGPIGTTLEEFDFSGIPPPPNYSTSHPAEQWKSNSEFQNQASIKKQPKNTFQKKKLKIKIVSENLLLQLADQTDWISRIDEQRLEWTQADSAPLEIKLLLVTLLKQASTYTPQFLFEGDAVSTVLPFSERFEHYEYNPKMRSAVQAVAKEFPTYRKIKGDGNCFYRAFNFSFLEMALTHKSSLYFLRFLTAISDTRRVKFLVGGDSPIMGNPLISPALMRSFLLQRLLLLYSYRVQLARSKDPQWETNVICLLEQVFNEPPYCFDAFLIVAIKNYILHILPSLQSFKYLDDSAEVEAQVLAYGKQCQLNQYPISALSTGLCVCLSLYQQIGGKCKFQAYGNTRHSKVILYYRPGHYDLIYHHRQVYKGVLKTTR